MTLRRNLITVFVVLTLLPVIVIALVLAFGSFRFAETRGRDQLDRRLQVLSDILTRELSAERVFLDELAERWQSIDPRLFPDLPDWFAAHLALRDRLAERLSIASRILFIDRPGSEAIAIERQLGGFSPSIRVRRLPPTEVPRIYLDLLDLEAAVPGTQTVVRPTGPVLGLPRRLPAIEDRPAGIVVEELPAHTLIERAFAAPGLIDLVGGYAARRQGTDWELLYHADPRRVGRPIEPGDFRRRGDRIDGSIFHEETGWLLGGSTSLVPLQRPLRRGLWLAAGLLSVVTVLVVAGFHFVTRGIGDTVVEFAEGTAAIARGDFDRTLQPRRRDEFAVIADHVNRMAGELKLTAEARAIARVNAKMVHDLKGVASQLKLLLHNLRENLDDPEFRTEVFQLIQGLADHMESLSLDLRPDRTAPDVGRSTVNLRESVEGALEQAAVRMQPDVQVEIDVDAGLNVLSDPDRLNDALKKVIDNAVEAMEGRGALRIRGGSAGPGWFLEIDDSGPGMPADFVERQLFRPFGTTKAEGLGLGMYEARQHVVALGGQIRVDSRPGEGTTVRFDFT